MVADLHGAEYEMRFLLCLEPIGTRRASLPIHKSPRNRHSLVESAAKWLKPGLGKSALLQGCTHTAKNERARGKSVMKV
jgi:hypothetical protein